MFPTGKDEKEKIKKIRAGEGVRDLCLDLEVTFGISLIWARKYLSF